MSGELFALDTNVLVYAYDHAAAAKQARARLVVDASVKLARCVISLQSIGEFVVAGRRRSLLPPAALKQAALDYMSVLTTVAIIESDARSALDAVARHQLSYWDALLLATVARARCSVLLSEDMQDGFTLDGVTVRNPFVGTNLPPLVAELLQS